MSLVPWAFRDFRDPFFVEPYRPSSLWDRPSRLWDIDRFDPWDSREFRELTRFPEYLRRNFDSLIQDSDAKVSFDKDKFQVNVDVQQFAPHEITVKTEGDTITVEGKHEEKPDEHGYIARQFVRRYVLPKGHDVNHVQSNLSSDGVLTITAPRTDQKAIGYKTIPIQRTGAPSKAVQWKK